MHFILKHLPVYSAYIKYMSDVCIDINYKLYAELAYTIMTVKLQIIKQALN